MTVRTNGAEFKCFYTDNNPAFWPVGAFHDDTEITVDGQEATSDVDLSTIPDNAVVSITAGIVVMPGNHEPVPFELHFKRWRKAQQTRTILVRVDVERKEAIIAAIKLAGGDIVGD